MVDAGEGAGVFPLAIVPVNGVKVTGDMVIADGRASIGKMGTITAMDHTATIVLPHRGNLHICTSTTLNLMRDASIAASLRSTEEPGLMMALDRGAMEANFATGQNSDVILTPDFRIVISGPGISSVQVRLGDKGDTCVENRGPNAPYVSVSSVFKGGVYRVQENQRVMFQHGGLDEVVDHESESCGCPSEEPASATGNDFPLAQSEGLTPLGKAPPNAMDKGVILGQVTAQFGYDGRKQKPPESEVPNAAAPAKPQSKIGAQMEKLDPRRKPDSQDRAFPAQHLWWLGDWKVKLRSAGSLDGSQDCLGFVEAFLIFRLGDGIGDDACACLDMSLAVLRDHGADGDAGVEIAGEIGVEG